MQFDGTNLWVGGEFTSIDSAPQQGLTRFGFLGAAQNHRPLKPTRSDRDLDPRRASWTSHSRRPRIPTTGS